MNQLLLRLGKVLLRAALDESLRGALPFVYRRLDSEIPALLIHRAPPAKIEGIIASAIGDAMGKRPSRREIDTVITLYDPVKAALRNVKRQ